MKYFYSSNEDREFFYFVKNFIFALKLPEYFKNLITLLQEFSIHPG